MSSRLEIDLTDPDGLIKLSQLFGQEWKPILSLDRRLRFQLKTQGQPITIAQVRKYKQIETRAIRNTSIILKLINQTIKTKKAK